MHAEVVTFTPELAAKLLEQNTSNRLITPARVNSLSAAMTAGRFVSEAAGPVITGIDGVLQNGQHRLHATIVSGVSWEGILITGAPAEAMFYHDTGKSRSFSDYLKIMNVSQNTLVASVTRLLRIYDTGGMASRIAFYRSRNIAGDHQQLWSFYRSHEDEIAQGIKTGRTLDSQGRNILTRSVSATGAVILGRIDQDDCQGFYDQLGLRDTEGVGPVATALINSLSNLPTAGAMGVRGDQQHQLALLFKGWNDYRDGAPPPSTARGGPGYGWRMGGARPEGFPIPR